MKVAIIAAGLLLAVASSASAETWRLDLTGRDAAGGAAVEFLSGLSGSDCACLASTLLGKPTEASCDAKQAGVRMSRTDTAVCTLPTPLPSAFAAPVRPQ